MMRQGYSISEISFLRETPRTTVLGWLKKEKLGLTQVQKRGKKEKVINPAFIPSLTV
jgi:hypothetical protein